MSLYLSQLRSPFLSFLVILSFLVFCPFDYPINYYTSLLWKQLAQKNQMRQLIANYLHQQSLSKILKEIVNCGFQAQSRITQSFNQTLILIIFQQQIEKMKTSDCKISDGMVEFPLSYHSKRFLRQNKGQGVVYSRKRRKDQQISLSYYSQSKQNQTAHKSNKNFKIPKKKPKKKRIDNNGFKVANSILLKIYQNKTGRKSPYKSYSKKCLYFVLMDLQKINYLRDFNLQQTYKDKMEKLIWSKKMESYQNQSQETIRLNQYKIEQMSLALRTIRLYCLGNYLQAFETFYQYPKMRQVRCLEQTINQWNDLRRQNGLPPIEIRLVQRNQSKQTIIAK